MAGGGQDDLQSGGGKLTEPDAGGANQPELSRCLPVLADPRHELAVGKEGEEGDIEDTAVQNDASATTQQRTCQAPADNNR